jgi:hypothetical protein
MTACELPNGVVDKRLSIVVLNWVFYRIVSSEVQDEFMPALYPIGIII